MSIKKYTLKALLSIIAIYVFWATLTLFNYLQIRKDLNDYSAISGKVTRVQNVELNSYKGSRNYAYAITIDNSIKKFGLHSKYKNYYNQLKSIDLIGKEIRIYYNPSGAEAADNLTLWIGQMEIENEIFFPIDAMEDYDSIGLKIQLIGLIIFTILLVYFIYNFKKERSNTSG